MSVELNSRYRQYIPFEARIAILRDAGVVAAYTVEDKFFARISDEEIKVAEVMLSSGLDLCDIKQYCVGGIWETVVNSLFYGMSPLEARLFMLERAYHPRTLTAEVKAYAEISDDTLLKANSYRHALGLTGICYWRKFHLSYIIKDMSRGQAIRFMLTHDYVSTDVPNLVSRHLRMHADLLDRANAFLRSGMELEDVSVLLGF